MTILVVHKNHDMATIWCTFLRRRGLQTRLATTIDTAMELLEQHHVDALVFDPETPGGGLPLADLATFRNPEVKILAVTGSTFFSDGTIFNLIPNARGVLHEPVRPEDLAAYLEYFGNSQGPPEKIQSRTA